MKNNIHKFDDKVVIVEFFKNKFSNINIKYFMFSLIIYFNN